MDHTSGLQGDTNPDEILVSHLGFDACNPPPNSRKVVGVHTRRSLARKERPPFVHPVPQIFKPVPPSDCVSVFGDIGRHRDGREMDCFPFML